MRLAHCSDLHLLSHDGARWLELANKRWIGAMNLLSSRSRHYHVAAFDTMIEDMNALGIEHVLCTGDVTNLALRQEFEFARGKFDRLAGGPLGVTVIPGNHDAYVAEGVPLFAEMFGDFATPDAGWEWTEDHRHDADDVLHWPIVRVRGDVALDRPVDEPGDAVVHRVRQGRAGPARPARARARGSSAGREDPDRRDPPPAGGAARDQPDPRPARSRGVRGRDRRPRRRADRPRPRARRSHRGAAGTDGRMVPVRGIASGTYFHNKPDRTARYRVFDIDDGQIRGDHVRVWDREHGTFATVEAEPQSNPGT